VGRRWDGVTQASSNGATSCQHQSGKWPEVRHFSAADFFHEKLDKTFLKKVRRSLAETTSRHFSTMNPLEDADVVCSVCESGENPKFLLICDGYGAI
jgi:hypothetical protein